MGITTEEFFCSIYKVLFEPKEFFQNEGNKLSLRLAAGVIAAMAAVNKYVHTLQEGGYFDAGFIFSVIGCIISALLIWFLAGLFFEYTAKIFDRGGKLGKFLYLSAFASIPALFFAPLGLLKNLSGAGYFISSAAGCIVYVWIIILCAFALKNTYNLTTARAFMFIFLPLIAFIPAVYQLMDFCLNMRYIFLI